MNYLKKNLALFYLKLTVKHHVPAVTVQTIVNKMKSIHDLSQKCFKRCLIDSLKEAETSENEINIIAQSFWRHNNDVFYPILASKGTLSTNYRRKQSYEKNFHLIQPITIFLGLHEDNVQ